MHLCVRAAIIVNDRSHLTHMVSIPPFPCMQNHGNPPLLSTYPSAVQQTLPDFATVHLYPPYHGYSQTRSSYQPLRSVPLHFIHPIPSHAHHAYPCLPTCCGPLPLYAQVVCVIKPAPCTCTRIYAYMYACIAAAAAATVAVAVAVADPTTRTTYWRKENNKDKRADASTVSVYLIQSHQLAARRMNCIGQQGLEK